MGATRTSSSDDTDAPVATEATPRRPQRTPNPPRPTPADTEPTDTEPTDTEAPDGGEGFSALPPPDGEPMIIGMVNTEGSPGLDFPEISTSTRARR